jgi:hypothetical protein
MNGGEGEVDVNVHGLDMGEVGFVSFRLNLPAETGSPAHDGKLRGGENGAIRL